MISNTRVTAPVPSRNWPYSPAIDARLAPIVIPYSRNPVRVPIAREPSITLWPVNHRSPPTAVNPRKPMIAPNAARHSASREPRATTPDRSAAYRSISKRSRT